MDKELIIITRPTLQSNRFKKQLINDGIDKNRLIISPVIEIKKIDIIPKITNSTIVIFTSENAVLNWNCENKTQFTCYCVGLNTTKTAQEFGISSKCLGNDIETFIKNFPQKNKHKYHYLRGKDITFNLTNYLRSKGVRIKETIVYKQIKKNLSNVAKLSLNSNNKSVITIFSTKAALTISSELQNTKFLNTEFLCLSTNIKKTLIDNGMENIKTSSEPTVESLIKKLTN